MAVNYERAGAAAVVTIDRPERRNAVDGPTAEALLAALERFEADDDARVMVLTGAGGVAFCAGADLKAIETYAGRLEDPSGSRASSASAARWTSSSPAGSSTPRRRCRWGWSPRSSRTARRWRAR